MADLFFVLLLVVAFAALVGLVKVCDRIIGAEDGIVTENQPDGASVAATSGEAGR
jgi:hypothetical protein